MTVSTYCALPSWILSNFLTKTMDCNILRIICTSLIVSVGRILIEMCVYVPLLPAHRCLTAMRVCVFRCGSLQVPTACVCVSLCVRDSLPLMYVPSFVSEDYSFPFEVRQLARRGRSERRPRAGFHTFPTAACRLGGKYVCRPQRQGERGKESEKGAKINKINENRF